MGRFRDDIWGKGNAQCATRQHGANWDPGLKILFPTLGVCHRREPSSRAPVPSGSPGSFRPRPQSVQRLSLSLWVPPLGTLTEL